MRHIQPKIIDYQNNKEFECLYNDAKLLLNLLEQKRRGYFEKTDYIQPGIGAGQSLGSVIGEILKSMNNHMANFDKDDVVLI